MSRKVYFLLCLAYLSIPVLVNLIVAGISFSFLSPIIYNKEEFLKLANAGNSEDFIFKLLFYISFIFPTALGNLYVFPLILFIIKKNQSVISEKIKSIIINLPILSATLSFLGWALASFSVIIHFKKYNIEFSTVSYFKHHLFNLLMANLCFVFSYYILDILNKILIRNLMPNENLSEIKNTIKTSIRFRFIIFFITVGVTPSILLMDFILAILYNNQIQGYYVQTIFIFSAITIIGIALTFFISNSFANPILKLQNITSEIKSGNLDAIIQIDSNDEIGFLGERFNEMSISIKEKEFIKDTFGKVVDPNVRDYLLKGNLALGGELKNVTVLFVDIRGFTTISEKLPPIEVVHWLNQYFDKMSECITNENGLVNKFIGDAILAVFGAPIPIENHAESAIRAAIEMRKQAKLLSESYKVKNLPELKIGIGIHTGQVLAGNIGSSSRLEYTVIGDTVNIASRLESQCKELGREILFSESCFNQLDKIYESELIGNIKVRGRENEIKIYTI